MKKVYEQLEFSLMWLASDDAILSSLDNGEDVFLTDGIL